MIRAIGLMSGTSLDAVDVALIETDGRALRVVRGGNGLLAELGPTGSRAYTEAERALLRAALTDAEGIAARGERPGCLPAAEALVTRAHAEAVEALLAREGLAPADIDLVGFHGQTVIHRPERGLTVQIGDAAALRARLGIPVVSDFRAADIAAGGQGAPLVPVFHAALARASGLTGALAILNLGGVGNVTFIAGAAEPVAFDTGPGNARLNDWMRRRTGEDFDRGGATAARGTPDTALVDWLAGHPWFARKPPKSLDRNWLGWLPHELGEAASIEDGAATLTLFTARAVAKAAAHAPEPPRRWIVAGGGVHNAELMACLGRELTASSLPEGVEVLAADALGWSADFLEAQAFAYLAARAQVGLPLTFPGTTGVSRPTTGGVLTP